MKNPKLQTNTQATSIKDIIGHPSTYKRIISKQHKELYTMNVKIQAKRNTQFT